MSFLLRYPEFTSVDKARIELAQQDAENQMSRKVWGKKFEQGRDALMAHMLYMSGALTKCGHSKGNPVQFATSKSAGAISIGYSAPDVGFASNHEGYALSTFGQEYLRLRKLVGVHVMVIP
ncbi:TPA: DUF4054 domain-containing protein [Providencia alcalifaciens]